MDHKLERNSCSQDLLNCAIRSDSLSNPDEVPCGQSAVIMSAPEGTYLTGKVTLSYSHTDDSPVPVSSLANEQRQREDSCSQHNDFATVQ
jgi:hypothetical protein